MGHRGRHRFREGLCVNAECGAPQGETDYASLMRGRKLGPRKPRLEVAPLEPVYAPPPKPTPPPCPRCGGFLHIQRDLLGRKEQDGSSCINCGYEGAVREALPEEDPDLAFAGSGKQRKRQPSHGKLRL